LGAVTALKHGFWGRSHGSKPVIECKKSRAVKQDRPMNLTTKALLVLLTLSTAACTRPDRFGGGVNDTTGAGAGAGAGAIGTAPLGAADPSSPQFFAQTIGDRVLFEVDSATLTAAGQATLGRRVGCKPTQIIWRSSKATPMNRARGNTTWPWARAAPIRCAST
jgi:hypothetical protein